MGKKKCFTLIEMLIVTSIIFILISLLQPSFTSIISKAHVLHCQNNLSKFNSALNLFLEDSNGNYPKIYSDASLFGKKGTLNSHGGLTPPENRILNHYLDSNIIAECPGDLGDVRFGEILSENAFNSYGTSYLSAAFFNRGGTVYLFGNRPKNIFNIDKPRNKFVLSDWTWGIARGPEYEKNKWHGGDYHRILNILFADGHVSLTDFTLQYELTKMTRRIDKDWKWW